MNTLFNNPSVKIHGSIAEITDGGGNTNRYTRKTLVFTIENIKKNRDEYFTEQTYRDILELYEKALDMMDSGEDN